MSSASPVMSLPAMAQRLSNEMHMPISLVRLSSSAPAAGNVPTDYRFSARAAIPGQTMGGNVEIRLSQWIVSGLLVKFPLQQNNIVSAGLSNTFMSVDVVPDVDVVITTLGQRIRNLRAILLLAVLVVAIAAAMVVAFQV